MLQEGEQPRSAGKPPQGHLPSTCYCSAITWGDAPSSWSELGWGTFRLPTYAKGREELEASGLSSKTEVTQK